MEKLLNELIENLQTIFPVLFCDLDAWHQRLIAEVLEVIMTCVECAVVQVDWDHFAVDGLGVDNEIYHDKWLFL